MNKCPKTHHWREPIEGQSRDELGEGVSRIRGWSDLPSVVIVNCPVYRVATRRGRWTHIRVGQDVGGRETSVKFAQSLEEGGDLYRQIMAVNLSQATNLCSSLAILQALRS
jgi:hypothetical protein